MAATPLMERVDATQTNRYTPSNAYDPSPNNKVHNDSSALLKYVQEKQNPPNGTKRHHMLYRAQRVDEAGSIPSPPVMNSYLPPPHVLTANSGHADSPSISPSTQLRQSYPQARAYSGYQNSSSTSQVERIVGHPATPLIDTLPRKKQKQLYQIIGGISSGLRNVREQTDMLQRQLDSLSAALGIDEDEGEESFAY